MRLDHQGNLALPSPPAEVVFEEERPRRVSDYVAVLRRNLRLAATCFAVTVALTVLITLLMPRSYSAATRLQVGRQSAIKLRLESNVISLDDSDRSDRAATSYVGSQAASLLSRDLAERVIRKHALDQNLVFLEPSGHDGASLKIDHDTPSVLRPRGIGVARDAAVASDPQRPIDPEQLDRYEKFLSVKDVQNTDLLDVKFVTPNPELSAYLAAVHTQAYLESNEDARHATDMFAQKFLARKLASARKKMKKAEAALHRFAGSHPSVAADQEQNVGNQRLTDLAALLTKVEGERLGLESRFDFLTSPKADPLAYFLDRPAVERLRLALVDVRTQKAGFDNRLGENHPRMVELSRLESELDKQLKAEVTRGVGAARSQYDAAKQQESKLRRELEQEQHRGTDKNRLAARYELLKNDVETARKLHGSLLEQKMATAATSDLGPSNVRVIDRAEVPLYPSWPKIPLNLAFGIAAGLVIGIGAAFSRDYFDHSVHSGDEIEALLHMPMLATIPNFTLAREIAGLPALPAPATGNGNGNLPVVAGDVLGARRQEHVVLHEPASPVAEAFRSVRTALLFMPSRSPRVIVVTSARAAEGKTVTSLNLATALAQSGSRVLLIEADLRHPRCHRMLGLYTGPGLSNYLAGQHDDLDAMVHYLEPPGLAFIPSGPIPPNPAELLGSARMHELLRACRARYDFVIVDTPPVLPVTDAVVVAPRADGVILVVKGNATPRQLVRRAHERLAQTGARLLGTIVNNVDTGWGDPYAYDAYYGYHLGARNGDEAPGMEDGTSSMAAWLRNVGRMTGMGRAE
jgi:capsular exopolysaccharide synthesis family protein